MDLVGKVLGKYKIIEKIGSGGMAEVYKGLQVGLEREVAIKLLPPEHSANLERLKRFKRESQATARLSHPNIITVYDSGEQDGYYYYVMEYLKAESLGKMIAENGTVEIKHSLKIIKDVLKALVYTHDKSIIHRDLKPDNIRFDLRGNAIVTDFGLVKDLDETSITMTGISLGTPQYMSPEQLLGEEVETASDIFQAGIILYEMLTGECPFQDSTPYIEGSDETPQIPLPSKFNPEITEELEEIIFKCLQRLPESRYSNANEVLQAITKTERKIDAKMASLRTNSSVSTRSFTTGSISNASNFSSETPTLSSTITDLIGADPSKTSWVLSILAGPDYEEQTNSELIFNISLVVIPAIMILILLLLYFTGNLFPRAPLKLLEQAIDTKSKKTIIAWKSNAPCYSFVEYYTSLDSRKKTIANTELQNQFKVELVDLEPDTTYYFQFIFTYDYDATSDYRYSNEMDFKTKPEIKFLGVSPEIYDKEVLIRWTTNLATNTKVQIGTTKNYLREQEDPGMSSERNHKISISGLKPETRYYYCIVASNPDSPDEETKSDDFMFVTKTLGYGSGDIWPENQQTEPPLFQIAKSYVDKLTRMTPDERQKLRHSLQDYMLIDVDEALNSNKKQTITGTSTNSENFQDRLRFYKVWSKKLLNTISEEELKQHEEVFDKTTNTKIANMISINSGKACRKLDKYLATLKSIDPEMQ